MAALSFLHKLQVARGYKSNLMFGRDMNHDICCCCSIMKLIQILEICRWPLRRLLFCNLLFPNMRGIVVILQPNLLRKSGQMFLSCCHFCFKKNLRMADMTPEKSAPTLNILLAYWYNNLRGHPLKGWAAFLPRNSGRHEDLGWSCPSLKMFHVILMVTSNLGRGIAQTTYI